MIVDMRLNPNHFPESDVSAKAITRVKIYKSNKNKMPIIATTCFDVIFFFAFLFSIKNLFLSMCFERFLDDFFVFLIIAFVWGFDNEFLDFDRGLLKFLVVFAGNLLYTILL